MNLGGDDMGRIEQSEEEFTNCKLVLCIIQPTSRDDDQFLLTCRNWIVKKTRKFWNLKVTQSIWYSSFNQFFRIQGTKHKIISFSEGTFLGLTHNHVFIISNMQTVLFIFFRFIKLTISLTISLFVSM